MAFITLNQEQGVQLAQKEKILYSEYTELLKYPEVVALIEQTMAKLNGQLAKFESIKRYVVLPREFTVEDGDLTPSLKVKRKHVCGKYKDELEALYKGHEAPTGRKAGAKLYFIQGMGRAAAVALLHALLY